MEKNIKVGNEISDDKEFKKNRLSFFFLENLNGKECEVWVNRSYLVFVEKITRIIIKIRTRSEIKREDDDAIFEQALT